MAIAIKASHKGALHKNLGVKQGQKLTATELERAKHSKDPAVRKRATFAMNARSWAGKAKKSGDDDVRHAKRMYGKKD